MIDFKPTQIDFTPEKKKEVKPNLQGLAIQAALRANPTTLPLSTINPASEEDSRLEEIVRDVGGLVGDIAISEGVPLGAGVGTGLSTLNPAAGIAAYLASRGTGGAMGSAVRQYLSNPEGIEAGQMAGDVLMNLVPMGKVGGSVAKNVLREGAKGAGAGVVGINAESLIDEGRFASLEDDLLMAGIGAVTQGVPQVWQRQGVGEVVDKALTERKVANQERVVQETAQAVEGSKPITFQEIITPTPETPPVSPQRITEAVQSDNLTQSVDSKLKHDVSPESRMPEPKVKEGYQINRQEQQRLLDLGLLNYDEGVDHFTLTSLAESAKKSAHWDSAPQIVKEQLKTPRPLNSDEVISVVNYLGVQREKNQKLLDELATTIDPVRTQQIISQRQLVQDEIDEAFRAVQTSGSMVSRSLNAMRTVLESDQLDFNTIQTRIEKGTGKALTKEETVALSEELKTIKALRQEIDEMSKKHEEEIQQVLKKEGEKWVEVQKRKKGNKATVLERREKAIRNLADMGINLNNVTMLAVKYKEKADALRELAMTYIDEGVDSLEDLVSKMTTAHSKLSEQDILNSIGRRVGSERKLALSANQQKIKSFEAIARTQAKINELLGTVEKLAEKGKPLTVENTQLKTVREQLQTLEKHIGDVASDSGKYNQILPKLQQLSNQLEGGYKSPLGKAGKDLEINPSIQKVKRDINWFKKEVKEISDTYDFEKTVAEVNRFLGKMDDNYLSRKVAVLAREIQQTKQKIRKPKSIEQLRSESFERSQKLMDELEKVEVQTKDEFRFLPPEKQEQFVSDLEQLLREKVQEANLVLRKKDQVYRLEQLLKEGGDLPTQTRKPASARIEGLNSAIALMKKEIKSQKALTDDELKALQRERVKVLSEKLDNYQKQYTEGWREWKKANPKQPKSVDEVELSEGIKEIQALIRAEDNIAELKDKNRRLMAGEDISDPRKQIKQESQELRDLRVKQRRMEKALKEKIYDAENQQVERLVKSLLNKKMTTKEFWKEYRNVPPEARKRFAINVGAIPRSMLATADISAYLRQGLIALNSMAYDPSRWSELGDIMRKTLKAAFDEKTFDEIMVDIKANPFYDEAESLGTAFTDVTHDLFGREEEFVSNLVERVPVLGKVVKASNRNMAAVLNMLRMSEMQHFLAKHADESTEVKKAYASYVNASTGRGNLGDFEQASRSLAQVFFSPKFAWSRYQVIASPFSKQSKVRSKAIKDLSKLAATSMGIFSLASMAGYDVGMDPADSDFGRVIIGDKRVDMLGGLQFPLRLAAYGMSYGTNEVGLTDVNHSYSMTSMILNSLNYKLNPLTGGVQSLISGEDWRGQPQGRFETLLRMSTPISVQEMYDSLAEDGYQPDDLLLPLNYLGGSVQDYND